MPWGEKHGQWKGDAASDHTKRQRARRRFAVGPCEKCGATHRTERHHIDGDPGNNVVENISVLCRRCHQEVDGRAARNAERLVASAKARAKAPAPCANCGRTYKPLRKGRCSPCYLFWRRVGRDIQPHEHGSRTSHGESAAA